MVEEIREAKNNGDWFNGSPIRNVNLTVASKMGISVKRVEKAVTSSKQKNKNGIHLEMKNYFFLSKLGVHRWGVLGGFLILKKLGILISKSNFF